MGRVGKGRWGQIWRSGLALAVLALGVLIWTTVQNIRAVPQLGPLLRDAFTLRLDTPEAGEADPEAAAYIWGKPDAVNAGEWKGCADFSRLSDADFDSLPAADLPPEDDLGWKSPVDVALHVRSGLFGRIIAAEASIAVLDTDMALADVIDPATGALRPDVVAGLPDSADVRAYRRLAGSLRFAMVQELGCPGFRVFQIKSL